jgi:hypothetical protein
MHPHHRRSRPVLMALLLAFGSLTAASAQMSPGQEDLSDAVKPMSTFRNVATLEVEHTTTSVTTSSLHTGLSPLPAGPTSEGNTTPASAAQLDATPPPRGTTSASRTPRARRGAVQTVIPSYCMNVNIKSFTKPCDLRGGYMVCDGVIVKVNCSTVEVIR